MTDSPPIFNVNLLSNPCPVNPSIEAKDRKRYATEYRPKQTCPKLKLTKEFEIEKLSHLSFTEYELLDNA